MALSRVVVPVLSSTVRHITTLNTTPAPLTFDPRPRIVDTHTSPAQTKEINKQKNNETFPDDDGSACTPGRCAVQRCEWRVASACRLAGPLRSQLRDRERERERENIFTGRVGSATRRRGHSQHFITQPAKTAAAAAAREAWR